MATEIVNAYNIFIDSERCINSSSDGDSINLTLNQTPISCADNQYIRLSLQSFSMYKSHTNVNTNNNIFRITHDGTTPRVDYPLYIPPANYSSLNDISSTWATQLATQLATDIGGGISYIIVASSVLPSQSGTSDNIISFTIDFDAAHGLTELLIRTLVTDGDSFEILGTNRIGINDAASVNSVSVDLSSPNSVKVQALYNGQLSSQQNVYLRTDVSNTNIQTESYISGFSDEGSIMSSSNILGRMIVDNDFVVFNTSSSDEYSISLTQRQITHMRVYLTDSHNRPIPQNCKYVNNVPVAGSSQLKLGNRSFEAVIKVEIMQYIHSHNNRLVTAPIPYSISPRFSNPLTYLNNGKPTFGNLNLS
jgi:hypothetical protein